LNWSLDDSLCLGSCGYCSRGGFWKDNRDTKIISWHKSKFIKCPLLFLPLCLFSGFAIYVIEQACRGAINGTWLAQNIARINHTKLFLCKASSVCCVCIYSAEGIASERVAKLWYLGCSVSESRQYFTQGGIFPGVNLLFIRGWQSILLEQGQSVE
jgi:hypothetical protein